ncbi:DUF5719 family protein [Brachybacterium huguangmaarense]
MPRTPRIARGSGGAGAARGRLRPVVALASLVPLAAAVALGAPRLPATPDGAAAVERGSVTASAPTPQAMCAGPLTVPQALLESGGDAALTIVPPSPSVSIGSLALRSDSSVLFGRTVASETRTAPDGSPLAPGIELGPAVGAGDGAAPATGDQGAATTASGPLGISVLVAPDVREPAAVATASAPTDDPAVGSGGSGGSDGSAADPGAVGDTVQLASTPAGDFRSAALTRCAGPVESATFLGAPTVTGASAALVLTNPSPRPSTALVQVTTPDGRAEMGTQGTVVVAPGATETVLLESIAPGADATGVSVQTVGSPLAMHVQSTRRDGLSPAGAEVLAPLPAAGTDQVLPGIRADADGSATAILLNTSGQDVTAELEVHGADGIVDGAGASGVEVPAGTVVEVPLASVPPGDAALVVRSTAPLSAVVRSRVTGADLPGDTIGAPVDVAYAVPADAIDTSSVLALPPGGTTGTLALLADRATAVDLIAIGVDGTAADPVRVELPEGAVVPAAVPAAPGDQAHAGVVVVPLDPGAVRGAYVLQPEDPATGPLLSSLPLVPAAADAAAFTVRAG